MPKSDPLQSENAKRSSAEQFIPVKNIKADDKSAQKSSGQIHFREQKGYFQRLRTTMNSLLVLLFFALPFISFDGRQAILLDVSQQQFFFFWPHALATGFHLTRLGVYCRRLWIVFHHSVLGARLVRLSLPANRVDFYVCLAREPN